MQFMQTLFYCGKDWFIKKTKEEIKWNVQIVARQIP